jgi:hypothetical protein
MGGFVMINFEDAGHNLGGVIVFVLMILGAVFLFYAGFKKLLAEKPASSSVALSFGFLLVVMLTISQFKRVKGFGFEAETWDQKQVEAARLVERLKGLTEATAQELAMIAARIGLWDNGLSMPELMQLLGKVNHDLVEGEIAPNRREDILKPISDRIEFNYIVAAYQFVYHAFREQHGIREFNPCQASGLQLPPVAEDLQSLCKLNNDIYSKRIRDLGPITSFVKVAKALDNQKALLEELGELETDLNYFGKNHSLRRQIDFGYLS